jgi:hypothetical protein
MFSTLVGRSVPSPRKPATLGRGEDLDSNRLPSAPEPSGAPSNSSRSPVFVNQQVGTRAGPPTESQRAAQLSIQNPLRRVRKDSSDSDVREYTSELHGGSSKNKSHRTNHNLPVKLVAKNDPTKSVSICEYIISHSFVIRNKMNFIQSRKIGRSRRDHQVRTTNTSGNPFL